MSDMVQRKNQRRNSSLKKTSESNVSRLLRTKKNSLDLSYSKSEQSKWNKNNHQLARENARLRNDVQKCIAALSESAVRYDNLELAWKRRGETLSRVDIISRLVGNQIAKLVDTLTELRSVCQVELATPLHEELTEHLDLISQLRHSMPIRTNKSTLHMQNRSQLLVNPVNPMVSGLPIIKPRITLRRIDLSNVLGEQNQARSQILSEVEIPLERLTLSQIAERIGSPLNRNLLESQENSSIFARDEMPSHISMHSILEESPETNTPRSNIRAKGTSRINSPLLDSPNSDWSTVSPSNRHSNNSARKYPSTSRVKIPTSAEQRNRMNADIEKCNLVVSLKDVGSYLHNGTLSNVELLEERKVKTGASAQSDLKVGCSNVNDDAQLNISSASGDQADVDFTTEIETIDYGALHNENEKENSFSATQKFLSRIKNEDPLEGPSWRYENITTREVRKRQRPVQSLNLSPSSKKNKPGDILSSISTPKRANNLDSSKLNDSTDEDLQFNPETHFNNTYLDTAEIVSECMASCEAELNQTPNTIVIEEEEQTKYFSDVSPETRDCLETPTKMPFVVKEEHLSPNKTECNLDTKCKSSSQSTNIGQQKTNKKQKRKNTPKPNSKERKKENKSESFKNMNKDIRQSRVRRLAAPTNLREPLLISKLRRE